MKTNVLFNDIMAVLWANDERNSDNKVARAVAAHIKTHRVNAENALEVINIMWPDATLTVRTPSEGIAADAIWFDVTFADGSQCMIDAPGGIGSAIEML